MDKTSSISWVQKNLSPLATRLFGMAFMDRRSVAWGIRSVSQKLSEKENLSLKMVLNKHGIILPKFQDLDYRIVQHYHLCKSISSTRLLITANEFSQLSGRDILLKLLPDIALGKSSGEVQPGPQPVDYYKVLDQTMRNRILRDLEPQEISKRSRKARIIEESFRFASSFSQSNEADLIYNAQKMADIGGDFQSIIASLFIDLPFETLADLFGGLAEEKSGIYEMKSSLFTILGGFHALKDGFKFESHALAEDHTYIFRKMSELTWKAGSPEILLLFFLHKLKAARQAISQKDRIFDEIRLLYAPLAERLGLIFLADDFRDQTLRLSDPKKYGCIENKVKQQTGLTYEGAKIFLSFYVKELLTQLEEKMGERYRGIVIKHRIKSPYSIYNKVEIRREYDYSDLQDILGIKIICESRQQLEEALGILKRNDLFLARAKGIKSSLEVCDPPRWRGIKLQGSDGAGKPLEIQLMTQEMNQENNRGKAATWKYNLEKELGKTEQIFAKLEPQEVMGSNFTYNFYQLKNYWTDPSLNF